MKKLERVIIALNNKDLPALFGCFKKSDSPYAIMSFITSKHSLNREQTLFLQEVFSRAIKGSIKFSPFSFIPENNLRLCPFNLIPEDKVKEILDPYSESHPRESLARNPSIPEEVVLKLLKFKDPVLRGILRNYQRLSFKASLKHDPSFMKYLVLTPPQISLALKAYPKSWVTLKDLNWFTLEHYELAGSPIGMRRFVENFALESANG